MMMLTQVTTFAWLKTSGIYYVPGAYSYCASCGQLYSVTHALPYQYV